MLNELEQLADKIARVLRHADTLAAENQRLRAEVERLQAEADVAKTERDAMLADRSVLNAKIEEARQAAHRHRHPPAGPSRPERRRHRHDGPAIGDPA
jgi:septal ring factor EnvC (AmiA/AmiB activator)